MNRSLVFITVILLLGFMACSGLEYALLSHFHRPGTGGFFSWLTTFIPAFEARAGLLKPDEILEYTAQIKWRWVALVVFFAYLLLGSKPLEHQEIPEKSASWLVRLFFVIPILYLPDLSQELSARSAWQMFYEPLPQFQWMVPVFPSGFVIQWVVLVLFAVGALLAVARFAAGSPLYLAAAVTTFLGWTYLLSLLFGFGKIDHTYASMFSAMAGMVIFTALWHFYPPYSQLGFRIFQVFIWGCYGFAGLEKLFLSGFDFLDSSTFAHICGQHPTQVCSWLAGHPVFACLFMAGGLCFQLSAFLLWRWRRWAFLFVPAGIFFHLGTWLVLGIGGWQSPWIPMLFFLWPMANTRKAEVKMPSPKR